MLQYVLPWLGNVNFTTHKDKYNNTENVLFGDEFLFVVCNFIYITAKVSTLNVNLVWEQHTVLKIKSFIYVKSHANFHHIFRVARWIKRTIFCQTIGITKLCVDFLETLLIMTKCVFCHLCYF